MFDLYSAQQGHAADWQIYLAHQLRDCQFAIDAGDAATYRKVTGGFLSDWGPDLFANFRSIVGTAARRGIDARA